MLWSKDLRETNHLENIRWKLPHIFCLKYSQIEFINNCLINHYIFYDCQVCYVFLYVKSMERNLFLELSLKPSYLRMIVNFPHIIHELPFFVFCYEFSMKLLCFFYFIEIIIGQNEFLIIIFPILYNTEILWINKSFQLKSFYSSDHKFMFCLK